VKPAKTAVKALFLNSFRDFLLSIFFPFNQPLWLYETTIMIDYDRCQVIYPNSLF